MENVYNYSLMDESVVEKLVDTKEVSIAHAIVKPGESFPKHSANANVHIIIIKGILSAKINGEAARTYQKGNILSIELDAEMELSSIGEESLEFFAVKAPSPTFK